MCVNGITIFNKVCLDLLNDIVESKAKHTQSYIK